MDAPIDCGAVPRRRGEPLVAPPASRARFRAVPVEPARDAETFVRCAARRGDACVAEATTCLARRGSAVRGLIGPPVAGDVTDLGPSEKTGRDPVGALAAVGSSLVEDGGGVT